MDKVYLSFSKNSEVCNKQVKVGDVASVWCADNITLAKVKTLTVINVPETESRRYVVSAVKIISIIEKNIQNIDIVCMGEPEFIVSYKRNKEKKVFLDCLKVFLVSVIVFCGSAFAIMAYENDIDINGVFESMNNWVTDGMKNGVLIQQISYSVGLAAGILVFYNKFGKRKSIKDPTPLDIQMRLYEDDINTAIIRNSEREEHIDDVQ